MLSLGVDKESSKIMEQNNFTNLNLQTISQQLSRIENQVQDLVNNKKEKEYISTK